MTEPEFALSLIVLKRLEEFHQAASRFLRSIDALQRWPEIPAISSDFFASIDWTNHIGDQNSLIPRSSNVSTGQISSNPDAESESTGPSSNNNNNNNSRQEGKGVGTSCSTYASDRAYRRFITLRLDCPIPDCGETFASKDRYDRHCKSRHRIEPHRCHVAKCERSFTCRKELATHNKSTHADLRYWPCAKCGHQVLSSRSLRNHVRYYHQRGLFGCTAAGCDSIAESRHQACKHYVKKHPNLAKKSAETQIDDQIDMMI